MEIHLCKVHLTMTILKHSAKNSQYLNGNVKKIVFLNIPQIPVKYSIICKYCIIPLNIHVTSFHVQIKRVTHCTDISIELIAICDAFNLFKYVNIALIAYNRNKPGVILRGKIESFM